MMQKLQLRIPGSLPRHQTLLDLHLTELMRLKRELAAYDRPFKTWQRWNTSYADAQDTHNAVTATAEDDVYRGIATVDSRGQLGYSMRSRLGDSNIMLTPSPRRSTSGKLSRARAASPSPSRSTPTGRSLSEHDIMNFRESLIMTPLRKSAPVKELSKVGTRMRHLQDEVYRSAYKHSQESFKRLGRRRGWQ